jgi:hypothetical protein
VLEVMKQKWSATSADLWVDVVDPDSFLLLSHWLWLWLFD